LAFEEGVRGPFNRVDQPQIVFDNKSRKVALCISIKEDADKVDEDLCYTAMIPLRDVRPARPVEKNSAESRKASCIPISC
jgi:hypothetical protein